MKTFILAGKANGVLTTITQAITGRYPAVGASGDAEALLGFGFGGVDANDPGISNTDLAAFAFRFYAGTSKILQSEVADAYAVLAPHEQVRRIKEHRQAGRYLDTREVAVQAAALLSEMRANRVVILAHPNHVPRVHAVCQRLGLSTLVPAGLESIRFDPRSCQQWTRSRAAWIRREIPSILYYRLKGWI